jgi:hypothetical protein
MTDYVYVTQEDWDQAQKALKAVLPLVEALVCLSGIAPAMPGRSDPLH